MEPLKYIGQIVTYNKTAHENLFGTYSRFTDETRKAAYSIVEKMGFTFGGNNEIFNEMTNMLKKSRENYKKAVDDGFHKIESYIKAA